MEVPGAGARRFGARRAMVTGASRGIGAAVAERLAAEGADLVITARSVDTHGPLPGTLRATADRLAGYGGRVAVIGADLTDPQQRAGLLDRAAEALGGPVDVLVNNAAAAIYQPIADFPLSRVRLSFEANVLAPLDLVQQALPAMRTAGEGWIVNVSSSTARPRTGPPFRIAPPGTAMAIYGSTKAALNRLTNGLAAEVAEFGIRVNTVEPRIGVATEGAVHLVGDVFPTETFETMEEMVEACVALCAAPVDYTGRVCVSLDLIAEWQLTVRGLDAEPLPTGPRNAGEAIA